ncbi:hypothetical protein CMK14_11665 [Candidatus Poribacteria bacterium]|nr:hypothetical protein [Candidatus Poribacteria bacterium]
MNMKKFHSRPRLRGLSVIFCLLLIVAPVITAFSATISPKSQNGNTKLITIQKGDTLWDLAQEYLTDPALWKEFRRHNDFTDPHLIYPGEELRIPTSFNMPAQAIVKAVEEKGLLSKEEIDQIKAQLAKAEDERTGQGQQISDLEAQIRQLKAQSQAFKKELADAVEELDAIGGLSKSLDELKSDIKNVAGGILDDAGEEIEEVTEAVATLEGKLSDSHKSVSKLVAGNESLLEKLKSTEDRITSLTEKVQGLEGQRDAVVTISDSTEEDETLEQLVSSRDDGTVSDEEFLISLSENGLDTDEKLEELHQQGILSAEELALKKEEGRKKKTIVVITALAGGIAWFAVNALGGAN